MIRIRDLLSDTIETFFDGAYPDEFVVGNGDILIGMDGDFNVVRWDKGSALLNQRVCKISTVSVGLDQRFLFWLLGPQVEHIHRRTPQTTVRHLSTKDLYEIRTQVPPTDEQRLIAKILDTLDTQIRQTEALIAKLEQIKQGLLTDLLTRGIDENGQLRPPPDQAPHLYKDSPLGQIPREWQLSTVGGAAESFIDGPFGSNLKTEHYVEQPGVRVVRLQNIQAGKYNDADRAFITDQHAMQLERNEVLPGDLLIAGLGDETNPLGRACLYPTHLPPAVNKADCYRMRGRRRVALNEYVMNFLNSSVAAKQVTRFQQGVTLQRINTVNLRRLIIPLVDIEEQRRICDRLASIVKREMLAEVELKNLESQKAGLMDDLLTGRVRVTPLLAKAESATV